MARGVCAILGYGPGLGAAYAEVFTAAGYDLALVSRSGSDLRSGTEGFSNDRAYACDVADGTSLSETLDAIERDLGPVDVVIYNADIARFGGLDDTDADDFEQNWRVAALGLFHLAKHLGPAMRSRGAGSIIVSGATAALRGNVWTSAFAPAKAAQRSLAQSLARQLGPHGVHVAYIVIDGVIDTVETRAGFAKGKPDDFFIAPARIAEAALMIVRQDRSAWTFELDLRPFGETW